MTSTAPRIVALDMLRGVAVLGILIANLPGFALPQAAYFSPAAWGGTSGADIAIWALTFVMVEGKMRGLFAMLFGASMLLVIERADARGANGAALHLRRMGTLFTIGCVHLYGIWYGDILSLYALVGILALFFTGASTRLLLLAGAAALLVATIDGVAMVGMAARPEGRAMLEQAFGDAPRATLLREIAALRGSWSSGVAWRWTQNNGPLPGLIANGPETLAYMLFGMAGLRSGFLTGDWTRRRYAVVAAVALVATLPVYAWLAWRTIALHFDVAAVVLASFAVSTPLRPVTVVGAAALVLSLRWPHWLGVRLTAAGRVALSNYLACSVVLTAVFYGWGAGQFARWDRAAPYLLLPPCWAAMLLWPRWWLARFAHGPAEWCWRTATAGRPAPLFLRTMRK